MLLHVNVQCERVVCSRGHARACWYYSVENGRGKAAVYGNHIFIYIYIIYIYIHIGFLYIYIIVIVVVPSTGSAASAALAGSGDVNLT